MRAGFGVLGILILRAAVAAADFVHCDLYAQASAPDLGPAYEADGPDCPALAAVTRGDGFSSSAAKAGSAAVRGSGDTAFVDANAEARLGLLISGPDLGTAVQVQTDVELDLQVRSHFDGTIHNGHAEGSLTLLRGAIPLPILACVVDIVCDAEQCARSRDCEGVLEAACPDLADTVPGPSASIGCAVSQPVSLPVNLPVGAPTSIALAARHQVLWGDASIRATLQEIELLPTHSVTFDDGAPLPAGFPPAEAPAPQIPLAPAAAVAVLAGALLLGARMSLERS